MVRTNAKTDIRTCKERDNAMSTQHTSGPWEDTGNNEVIKIQQAVTLQPIAFIKPGYSISNHSAVNANARLIAACPSMYEYIARKAQEGDIEARGIIKSINGRGKS